MLKENNSYLKMKDYFENLVEKSAHVKSFAGYFQRELMNKNAGDELESPYLALFDYTLGLSGPEQNTISVRRLNFAVMFENVPDDDLEAQYNAVDQAEAIILKFLSRIRLEAANENHFLYRAFRKENILIAPIELSLTAFGAECVIEFQNSQALKALPEDWTDDFLTC